jgi:AcrR family transcriptional regulator
MMNTDGPNVRQPPAPSDADDAWEDERVSRSRRALRQAMGELLHEGDFGSITVQQILERAGVARATFYKHYRNKDDVFVASFAGMVAMLHERSRRAPGAAHRLLPVRELLEHVAQSGAVVQSLAGAGRLERLWDEAVDVFAARIAPQLVAVEGTVAEAPALVSRVVGAALVEMIRWSMAHPGVVSPHVLDARFQEMARRTCAAFGCRVDG